MALAEGIETGLAVHELTGAPGWATVSAGGMRRLELPPVVRVVTVAGDNDENGTGQDAEVELAFKWSGRGPAGNSLVTPNRRRLGLPGLTSWYYWGE
ncbi:MAG: toprim domain-containing protein [Deltaproteobacteria bacterium]|nr:toprim domain-containing protein [Deltaproteobacteria bacterium]